MRQADHWRECSRAIKGPVALRGRPAQNAAGSTEAPVVEPEALAALNRMGAALRALNAMTLDAQTTNESVLETGQKLQFAGTVHIVAQKAVVPAQRTGS